MLAVKKTKSIFSTCSSNSGLTSCLFYRKKQQQKTTLCKVRLQNKIPEYMAFIQGFKGFVDNYAQNTHFPH